MVEITTYTQKHRQFLGTKPTALYTDWIFLKKISAKTGIYRVKLPEFVDNLCNCVEKPAGKLVETCHLLECLCFLLELAGFG